MYTKHCLFLCFTLLCVRFSSYCQETISNSGNFRIVNSGSVGVFGDLSNNGSFIMTGGTIYFAGTSNQSILGNSALSVYNMTVNNSAGIQISNEVSLSNALSIINGDVNTGDSLTIISDSSNTGRITEIENGSVIGDITMQRYIDAGATNWRFLTFAVSGQTLEQFDDDFITSGFPGTDYPTWPSASNPWSSFYFYDESLGVGIDDGFYVPSSTSDVLGVGQGVWIWCGDTLTGTQPFTIDVTGPANQGNINLPVFFNNSAGDLNDDGWNMVANPYPCAIDWNSSNWVKTNIDDAIYIWNPENAQYASYVSGVGTNLGSNLIASSQAFWVHANASTPVLTITESCKVDDNPAFLRASAQNPSLLRLQLNIANSLIYDETVIRFDDFGSDLYDVELDARKFVSNDINSPLLASITNGIDYSINTLKSVSGSTEVFLKVVLKTPKNCTLKATDVSGIDDLACVILEDLVTGYLFNLKSDSIYNFYQVANISTPRFKILFTSKPTSVIENVTCFDANDGKIVSSYDLHGNSLFLWQNEVGDTLKLTSSAISDSLLGLNPGVYYVSNSDPNGYCPSYTDTIEITQPSPLKVAASTIDSDCDTCCNGSINLLATGGNVPYDYFWSDSLSNLSYANQLCPGFYDVLVVDSKGCSKTLNVYIAAINLLADEGDYDWYLYPNPVSDQLLIEGETNKLEWIRITDENGRVVKTCNDLHSFNGVVRLNLEGISPGVYVLQSQIGSRKFVVR